jgi:ABC-type sugar transport system permease subunit
MRNNLIFVAAVPGFPISLVARSPLRGSARLALLPLGHYLPTILSAAVVGTLMRVMFQAQGGERHPRPGRAGAAQHDWLGSVSTAFMVPIFASIGRRWGRAWSSWPAWRLSPAIC